MTYPHDPIRILPITVGAKGEVRFRGLTFWSEEAEQYAGRGVELRLAPAPHKTALLLSMHKPPKILCEVQLIADTGFADVEAARTSAERLAKKRKAIRAAAEAEEVLARTEHCSLTRAKIEALLQIIDHRIDQKRDSLSTGSHKAIGLILGHVDRVLGTSFSNRFCRGDVTKQQMLERENAVLQLGDLIFGHNVLLSDGSQRNATGDAGHRLCGDAK